MYPILISIYSANPFDPSPTDAASLKYSFSFDVDTTFEISAGTETKAVVPVQFRTTSPNHIVRGRIEDKDGKVTNPRFVSGAPVFRDAAFDAVKQWQYKPAVLNGQPVEQEQEITLNFK